jgi:hypothetical protein
MITILKLIATGIATVSLARYNVGIEIIFAFLILSIFTQPLFNKTTFHLIVF